MLTLKIHENMNMNMHQELVNWLITCSLGPAVVVEPVAGPVDLEGFIHGGGLGAREVSGHGNRQKQGRELTVCESERNEEGVGLFIETKERRTKD